MIIIAEYVLKSIHFILHPFKEIVEKLFLNNFVNIMVNNE